jgi:hypothetical protein
MYSLSGSCGITTYFFTLRGHYHTTEYQSATFLQIMSISAMFRLCLFAAGAMAVLSCSHAPAGDACCRFTELTHISDLDEGQGLLQIDGSTSVYYYILDESGQRSRRERLNHPVALDPGTYSVEVNGSVHAVSISSGYLARCSTGTLVISGKTAEYYDVTDPAGAQVASQVLGKPLSLFPGEFVVRINNTETTASVRPQNLTEIHSGSLLVHGTTEAYYYVLDKNNKQLNFTALGKLMSFLPGTYQVKLNNTSISAEVLGGKVTELNTGALKVNGLTEEYYYVTDTVGNALSFQVLGKPIALLPGKYKLQVNNTSITGDVAAGQMTEFNTGSITLTGAGTAYYYVFDESGKQLNHNVLNKSLSFFPSDYVVRIGASERQTSVIAGHVTSLEAFNQ